MSYFSFSEVINFAFSAFFSINFIVLLVVLSIKKG